MIKRNLLAVFGIVACIALGLSAAHGQQGRYANTYNRAQVDAFVQQLETSSNTFREDFRTEVNSSGLNYSTKRTYNGYADQFENAVDRLRNRFNSNDSWWESRNEVRSMISNSQNLNTTMNTAAFRRRLERQWNQLRNAVNKLADTYDLPGLNGGGWTGGGGGGFPGSGGGNVPSWARGTFYGRNPQTGGSIELNINGNGSVTISSDRAAPTYATITGTTMTNGPYVSRLSRINNGIRTTDVTNGSFIDYYRTEVGGNPGQGEVPIWARGRFYGRNPQTGGTITLDINGDGTVSVSMDGGAPTYATINGTTMTNGPYVSRLSRITNGIRTTDVTNGSHIDYLQTPLGGNPGQGSVPTWAIGTFYGRNPQTGGNIVLTVQRNGTVAISVDGAAPVYASLNGTTMTNGPYVSRLSRITNGIRTTDVSNGTYIDYFRR